MSKATTHQTTPLNITGNTTPEQQEQLQKLIVDAAVRAARKSIDHLDRQTAGFVLELHEKVQFEIAESIVSIVKRFTISDKYKEEDALSTRVYPDTYRIRSIEAQTSDLRKFFPSLNSCMEKLARKPLPEGAEGWFAIPRWQAIAGTYGEAVEFVLTELDRQRKFSNRVQGRLDQRFLRQVGRSAQAWTLLEQHQPNSDIFVVPAQLGMLHRGCSARRARVLMLGNEFGLGTFAMGCILLTHPERLSSITGLMIDCCGDEYSLAGDTVFDRVPLYDFDLGGMQFSVFYEDRARSLWGSPSAFLVQI